MPLHINNEALSCHGFIVLTSANEIRVVEPKDGRRLHTFLLRDLHTADLGWHRATAKWPGKGNCTTALGLSADGRRMLVFAPEEFMCYCLSVPDLAVVWKRSTEEKIEEDFRHPLAIRDRYIWSSQLGWVTCWEVETGSEVWRVKLPGYTYGISSDEDYVCVSTKSGLVSLDQDTGSIRWSVRLQYASHPPALGEGVGYLGSSNGPLHAIDLNDGKILWSAHLSDYYLTAPALDKGELYIGAGPHLWAVDAENGVERWRFPRERNFGFSFEASSPVVTQDYVIVGGGNSNMVWMLSRKTGEPVWSYETKGQVRCNPIVVDGRLIIGSHDKHFYCFESLTQP